MRSKKIFAVVSVLIIVGVLGITYFLLNRDEDKPKDDKTKDDKPVVEEKTDAQKFADEYPTVTEDNVFVYATAEEIIKVMENGTGVVYLGFPECPWCQAYVVYLNEVAQDVGIEEIYYYNVLEDRKNETEDYKKMVELLEDELEYDDKGNRRIYVPNVSFHVQGELIGNDLETAYDTNGFEDPADYWTDEEVKDLKKKLTVYMETVYNSSNACSDCNK